MEYGNFLQTFIKKKEGITWMFLNEEHITLIIQILKKKFKNLLMWISTNWLSTLEV